MELAGKKALLTGATGGLGRAIATSLARRGALLTLSSRKGPELEELAASLPGDGHRAVVIDLAGDDAPVELANQAGEIDVLVANAGLPASGALDDFSQDELGRALRVNLEGPIRMTRELLPRMRERGVGHLAYVASLAGKVAPLRASVYSATKFGLRGFAMGLRDDLHGTGIGVSVVLPGFIRDAGMFADSGAKTPLGLGTASPEDVGEGVVKAIERNKQQVDIAPLRQRVMVSLGHHYPGLASRIQRAGGTGAAEEIASGQLDKR